jgi:hypothetical protein
MQLETSAAFRARLARLPPWLGPATAWAARFTRHGPGWMPRAVRRVPLRLACLIYLTYARDWL